MSTAHRRPVFGSDDRLAVWQRECNALAGTMTSDYAVAPLCSIVRVDGSVVGAGAPVSLADFAPFTAPTGVISPQVQLDRAVRDGAVVRRGQRYPVQDAGGDGPAAA